MAPVATSPAGYLPVTVYMTTSFTGALLIGTFFAVALTGVLAHMAYVYYDRFPSDRPIFKAAVGAVLGLNVLHSAFICVYEYQNLIEGFGNIATLTDLKWGLTGSFTLTAVIACIVELFYAYRVYALLGRNLIIPAIVAVLGITGVAFTVYLSVRLSQIYITFPTPRLVEAVNWLYAISFALPAAADLLIVAAMIAGLLRTHKLELPASSWKAIRKVIFYAIETNTLITVLCLIAPAMFATARRPIAFAIGFNLPKIYGITLVSSLLARQSTGTGIKGDYAFDATNSTTTGRRTGSHVPSQLSPVRQVRIATTTQTVVEKDGHLELFEQGGYRHSDSTIPEVPMSDVTLSSSQFSKDESIDDIPRLTYA